MHFYAVNVCPSCGYVNVDPSVAEDEAGTTHHECYQCAFEGIVMKRVSHDAHVWVHSIHHQDFDPTLPF